MSHQAACNSAIARIAADYLVIALGRSPFTWGRALDTNTQGLRSSYLKALKQADGGDIEALITFARG